MKDVLTEDDKKNIQNECEVLETQINVLEEAILNAEGDIVGLNKIGLSAGKISGSIRKLFFHIGVFEENSNE